MTALFQWEGDTARVLESSKGLLIAASVLVIGVTLILTLLALRPGSKWATATLAAWLAYLYWP